MRVARRMLLGAGALGWLTSVAAGFGLLARYESTPGAPAAIARSWPCDAPIALGADRPTLLAFIHPECPCTASTIEELARLLARCPGRVHTEVFCYADPALGAQWAHSGTWDAAAAIPGVAVHEDPRGAIARRFGARTSGQVSLYGCDGALLFEGGITPARGHAGDNLGVDVLLALLNGGPGVAPRPRCSTQVYGCSLFDPTEVRP